MINSFGWKRVGILHDSNLYATLLVSAIRTSLTFYDIDISMDRQIENETLELEPALIEMKNFARSNSKICEC